MVSDSNITPSRQQRWYALFLCLLGAYLNAAAYGFDYPQGADYDLLLPLTNWLRDPSLYVGDPIREAFTRFPSYFWLIVAKLSNWFSTEHVLLAFFVLTKLIFFLAIGRLVATAVRDKLLGACVVAVLALSGLLNWTMPIGGARVLSENPEHALLAIPMLFLVGSFLVDGRWWSAVVLAGLSVYIDALPFLHTLFAFLIFAIIDWRERKRRVLGVALVGAIICLPWLLLSYRALEVTFPKDYLQALWMFYPGGLTLRFTPVAELLKAASILVAMGGMLFVAKRAGLDRQHRLEVLALSYFIPLALGIVFGDVLMSPALVRLQFLRADSFLLPYAVLLIQVYGANLVSSRKAQGAISTFSLGVLAILLPLSIRMVAPLLLVMLILWMDPKEHFERFCRGLAGPVVDWFIQIPISRSVAVVCGLGIVLMFSSLVKSPARLWNFHKPIQPDQVACDEIQDWARTHTLRDARFLVPLAGCGFRDLSERSSWGEWMDGVIAVHYPPFADVFLQRMATFGLRPSPKWQGGLADYSMVEKYKAESWDRLRAIAEENHLDYIVQFHSVHYPATPVFENQRYSIYRVTN